MLQRSFASAALFLFPSDLAEQNRAASVAWGQLLAMLILVGSAHVATSAAAMQRQCSRALLYPDCGREQRLASAVGRVKDDSPYAIRIG